ncbi:MAG TPA: excinuclease ABC subunit A, partial [Solibacterales bacterium]|nr:excinuclease ABC subunit A [Bryobacterales bacterium]
MPAGDGSLEVLKSHLFDLRKKGFTRLFQNSNVFEFSTPESLLDIDFAQPVYVLVDRVALGPDMRQRLVDTVEICYRESGEVVFRAAAGQQLRFSEKFVCKT